MDIEETGCVGIDCLSQDWIQWRALVNTVVLYQISSKSFGLKYTWNLI